jgi:23S rRNA C2498 (ribose-2'-O)-methylase RlmM
MCLAAMELLPRGRTLKPFVKAQGTCITFLVPLRNVISEQRMLQNRRELCRLKMDKFFVKMDKILVKM